MAKKDARFHVESVKDHGFAVGTQIIVDKKTGVNYLFFQNGYAGGLTPLLNRDGTPVITTVSPEYEE